MADYSNDASVITARKIRSSKWFMFASVLIAAAVDLFALTILAKDGAGAEFLTPVCLMFVLDALFAVLILFSSYRFRYSRKQWIIYVFLTALLTCVTMLVVFVLSEFSVMTVVAAVAWCAVHLAVCVVTVFTALYASGNKKVSKLLGMVAAVAFMLIFAVAYTGYAATAGYFGQGENGEIRAVTYAYDDVSETYTATGVLDGRGGTVIIPETFNGKKVSAVDAALFALDDISKISIPGEYAPEIVNTEKLAYASESLVLEINVENIDSYRKLFYECAVNGGSIGAVSLANSAIPCGLEENEVYVTFAYDADSYLKAGRKIIPTWTGEKGEIFRISFASSECSYTAFCDVNDIEDLHSAYIYNNKYIMNPVAAGNGSALDGSVLNGNVKGAEVSFSKVYRVSLGEDNDLLYEDDTDFATFTLNGNEYDYTYVVASTANALLASFRNRDGFGLSWKYSSSTGSSVYNLSDFGYLLSSSTSERTLDAIKIYPEWKLNSPVISSVSTEHAANTLIYGESMTLTSTVTAPTDGLYLTYQWKNPENGEIGTDREVTLSNMLPSQSGQYVLTVTAASDTLTSLTSVAERGVNVTVNKRELGFVWNVPEESELVYKGADFTVSADYVEEDVINSDSITYLTNGNTFRNAGQYTVNVSLQGDAADKYIIAQGQSSVTLTVKKYVISAPVWGVTVTFVYDGESHAPAASVNGVGDDGELALTVAGAKTSVGTYTATAVLADEDARNYEFENATTQFTVQPRPATLVWNDVSYVYNGGVQHPSALSAENVIEKDYAAFMHSVMYMPVTDCVNAGEHTVGAEIEGTSNYVFESPQTKQFVIIKRTVGVTSWSWTSAEYDGTAQRPQINTVSNVIPGEEESFMQSITYSDGEISVGTYTVSATLPEVFNYSFNGNPTVFASYSITKRTLTLSVANASKTYDGTPFEDFRIVWNGLADTDVLDEVVTVTFGGSALTAVNAGKYEFEFSYAEGAKAGNYDIDVASRQAELTIAKKTVVPVWSEQRTFVYDGTEHGPEVLSLEGVTDGDVIVPAVSGKQTYAGSYIMTAYLSENGNYTFAGGLTSTVAFGIEKRALVLTAKPVSKVYDGRAYEFSVADLDAEGLAPTDTAEQFLRVSAKGDAVESAHAGTRNYTLSIEPYGNENKFGSYDITFINNASTVTVLPAFITSVTWQTVTSFEYDGTPHGLKAVSVEGAVSGEEEAVLALLVYSGAEVNAGEYTATVALPENSDYAFAEGAQTTCGFTVRRRELVVNAADVEKSFDDIPYAGTDTDVTGLAEGDSLGEVLSVTLGGTALGATSVGVYDIVLTFTNVEGGKAGNYNIVTEPNATLQIVPAKIVPQWSDERVFVADGEAKSPYLVNEELLARGDVTYEYYVVTEEGEQGEKLTSAPSATGKYMAVAKLGSDFHAEEKGLQCVFEVIAAEENQEG